MPPPGQDLLLELTSFNSHTYNPLGVNQAGQIASRELRRLGFHTQSLPVPPATTYDRTGNPTEQPLGNAVLAHIGQGAPSTLLCIHLDTVHEPSPPGPAFETTLTNDRITGPGVVDAKGGLVVLLLAVERFLQSRPLRGRLEVLLNPDEEIGSPSSAPLLQQAAQRNSAALVFEPSFPDGALVAARKGSGTYTLVVNGRSAHAGRDFAQGRNAAVAAARAAVAIDALNGVLPDTTLNVGVFESGSAPNVVPDAAILRINVRVASPDHVTTLDTALRQAVHQSLSPLDGISHTLHGGLTSPPRPVNHLNQHLFDLTQQAALELGLNLPLRDSGGTCDGNKLAAYGLPTIDSLGPTGGELHSTREYLLPHSLSERANLTAKLLEKLHHPRA